VSAHTRPERDAPAEACGVSLDAVSTSSAVRPIALGASI